jgi:1-acyl-sn-glycerol-3-phosphate acyltransferase
MRDRDSSAENLRRRLLTVPLMFTLGLLAVALLPLTLALGGLAALVERRRGATLRCVLFFTSYLVGEMLFLSIAFLHWIAANPFSDRRHERLSRSAEWLADHWGNWLHHSGRLLFGFDVAVEGLEAFAPGGPVIVLMRHASMGDTVLAPVYVGRHGALHLRYVAKRELRNDPLFDVIGGRLGSVFVRRGSSQGAAEVEAVCAALESLGPRDAVVLYPEGTRFSVEKRARILRQLAAGDRLPDDLVARAREMRHVLPPRLGGPVALLERNPGADVVFCTHVGYEGSARFSDLLSGRAIGRHIQVSFRRVPFAEIPTGREAVTRWLFDEWAKLDRWIDERLPADRDGAEGDVVVYAPRHGRTG